MKFNISCVEETTPLVPYKNLSAVPCTIKFTLNKTQHILIKKEYTLFIPKLIL